jgi:hypothetical protein
MAYRCARHLGGRIILENVTPAESDAYVKGHCREYFEISPDSAVFRETLISLQCPMLAGIRTSGKKVLIPFFKRCSGCVLVEATVSKKDLEAFRSLCSIPPPGDR